MNYEEKYIYSNDFRNHRRDFVCVGNVYGIDTGMECTKAGSHMVVGIIVGIVGIVVLLCLIPFVKGLK